MTYDVIIIGSGSIGLPASMYLAEQGQKEIGRAHV